eukprot:2434769-Ditylum_brightwellii.AAC.2
MTFASHTLKALTDTGGEDKHAVIKLYEALVSTKVKAFDSKIRAYKATLASVNKTLKYDDLIQLAQAAYNSLVKQKVWSHKQEEEKKTGSRFQRSNGCLNVKNWPH